MREREHSVGMDLVALEAEAGIRTVEERSVFWRQFGDLPPADMLTAGLAELERRIEASRQLVAEPAGFIQPGKAVRYRLPFAVRILLWPIRMLLKMMRSLLLFCLMTLYPITGYLKFSAVLSSLFVFISVLIGLDQGFTRNDIFLTVFCAVSAVVSWAVAYTWRWLLLILLPKDDVLFTPY